MALSPYHSLQTDDSETEISLPNWVPGSYLSSVTLPATSLIHINACCNGKAQPLTQNQQNHWQTPCSSVERGKFTTPSTHSTCLYAARSSVPSAAFSTAHALLKSTRDKNNNHTKSNFPTLPHTWQITTTLPQSSATTFQTASYAELIDHPC